jgi:hypothetical protein
VPDRVRDVLVPSRHSGARPAHDAHHRPLRDAEHQEHRRCGVPSIVQPAVPYARCFEQCLPARSHRTNASQGPRPVGAPEPEQPPNVPGSAIARPQPGSPGPPPRCTAQPPRHRPGEPWPARQHSGKRSPGGGLRRVRCAPCGAPDEHCQAWRRRDHPPVQPSQVFWLQPAAARVSTAAAISVRAVCGSEAFPTSCRPPRISV